MDDGGRNGRVIEDCQYQGKIGVGANGFVGLILNIRPDRGLVVEYVLSEGDE